MNERFRLIKIWSWASLTGDNSWTKNQLTEKIKERLTITDETQLANKMYKTWLGRSTSF